MPWQPMHISIFCAPAAASPVGAGDWADAVPGSASAMAAANKSNLVIDRLSSELPRSASKAASEQTALFYGLSATPVKPQDDACGANASTLEQRQLDLDGLPFVGIGRCRLALDNRLPHSCEVGVDCLELL